jgi:RsiW-degrading membrane proteinase PrsW (M82 family)
MNINATLFGQIIVVLAIFMAVVGFYLGKRKTKNPILTSVIAFFTAVVPVFAFVFLAYLIMKEDLPKDTSV